MLGGFIWDWLDQGLEEKDAEGNLYWGYGGDYERPDDHNDSNFLINGLLNPDRSPKPAMWTCKYVFQPVEFSLEDGYTLCVKNRKFHTGTADYRFTWELEEEGKVIQKGELVVPEAAAGETVKAVVPVKEFRKKTDKTYLLNVYASEKNALLYAETGHVNSKEQFVLAEAQKVSSEGPCDKVRVTERENVITVIAGTTEVSIDKTTGYITALNSKDNPVITSALKPHFWRAQTDNDRRGWRTDGPISYWRNFDEKYTSTNVNIDGATVKVVRNAGEQVYVELDYHFYNDGSVKVGFKMVKDADVPEPLRVGMQTQIPAEYSTVTYFGHGEFENYPDRNAGAFLGVYTTTIDDMRHEYVRPQECGNRTGVRWLTAAQKGKGVKFVSDENYLNMSLWPFSEAVIENAMHINELPHEPYATVNVDHNIAGVGGIDTWSSRAAPIEAYRLLDNEYEYSFTIVPIR